jgi:hypothetical protein
MSAFHNNILAGASGAGGAEAATYVDDVFSIFTYEGTSATRSINNGIDLDGEGGLVWIKARDQVKSHIFTDTERGVNKYIRSDSSDAEQTNSSFVTAFNSNGFSLGDGTSVNGNFANPKDYVSWTFRKAPGFFDVVTYTGNGTAGRTVSHNLGSVPGAIWVKELGVGDSWGCYHRSLGNTKAMFLNGTGTPTTNGTPWNNTDPTSTEFTVGSDNQFNGSGRSYVAYIFAHDDQSFGTNSDEAIIKCGSYTGTGTSSSSVGPEIDLGFEPQWLLVRNYTSAFSPSWIMEDVMRGFNDGQRHSILANTSGTELSFTDSCLTPTPTGFKVLGDNYQYGKSGNSYIYIAIRRPHKPPAAGTDVFKAIERTGNETATTVTGVGFPLDLLMVKRSDGGGYPFATVDRLRGALPILRTDTTAAEVTNTSDAITGLDSNDGFKLGANTGSGTYQYLINGSNYTFINYSFRRAPGFFDIVAYSGTGADQTVNHNLGVTPELMILKARSTSTAWRVFYKDGSTEKNLQLSTTGLAGSIPGSHPWSPSVTTFRADQYFSLSQSGQDFIAYAFATLAGISKVGLFSGTGSDVDVDCGFTAGARFVLIKRTDSSGDWYLYDTVRGIVSGNDPYLLLNKDDSEVTNTDYIDPLNSGFTVTSSAPAALNASGGTYLFLAIA